MKYLLIDPYDSSIIIKLRVHKRGNSYGVNLPKSLRDKMQIDPEDELGFFIKTDRKGNPFMAVAKVEKVDNVS